MYNKTGDLQTGILDLYDAMGSGTGVATEMAAAINSTESQKFTVLKQQMHNVTEELGNNLLPTVNNWISTGTGALSKVSDWIQSHQKLAGTIMTLLLYFGVFLTVADAWLVVKDQPDHIEIVKKSDLKKVFGKARTRRLIKDI